MRRLLFVLSLLAAFSARAQGQSGVSAEVDMATGSLKVGLWHIDLMLVGFEAGGNLQFNTSATGRLIPIGHGLILHPTQKDATNLSYFTASGFPAGDYVAEGILPTGLRRSSIPTNMSLTFAYTKWREPTVVPWTYYFTIPEPSTLALGSFALISHISLAAIRRRK